VRQVYVLDSISSHTLLGMQLLFTFLLALLVIKINGDPGDFRPPAVPLIVFSPHISSESDLYFTQDRNKGRGVVEQTHFYN